MRPFVVSAAASVFSMVAADDSSIYKETPSGMQRYYDWDPETGNTSFYQLNTDESTYYDTYDASTNAYEEKGVYTYGDWYMKEGDWGEYSTWYERDYGALYTETYDDLTGSYDEDYQSGTLLKKW